MPSPSSRRSTVCFFDIGGTLASVRVSPDGTDVEALTVLPGVRTALRDLSAAGIRLGVISDRGPIPVERVDAALAEAGLGLLLDPALRVYARKDSTAPFERAAALVAVPDDGAAEVAFVGESEEERRLAGLAGFATFPSPSDAAEALLSARPDQGAR